MLDSVKNLSVPSAPDAYALSSGAESIRLCLSVSGLSVSGIEAKTTANTVIGSLF